MLHFAQPWFLLLLAPLALLPRLMRRGPAPARVLNFAAMALVRAAVPSRVQRGARPPPRKLLWLRLAALGLFVVALAQPGPTAHVAAHKSPVQALFVLDTSPSMAYVLEGTSLIERARRSILNALAQNSFVGGVGLICTAPQCPQRLPLGSSPAQLKAQLQKPWALTNGESLAATLRRAHRELMRRGQAEQTAVLIASDGRQGAGPSPAEEAWPATLWPPRWLSVADAARMQATWPNVALGAVEVHAGDEGAPDALRLTVRVHNYGSEAIDWLRIGVFANDVLLEQAHTEVQARGQRKLTFRLDVPAGEQHRLHVAVLDAGQDGFAADDHAWAVVPPHAALEVTAINGEPSEAKGEDELYYLGEALRQLPAQKRPVRLRQLGRAQLLGALAARKRAPDTMDVLVLANVGRLQEPEQKALAAAIEGGLGVLVSAGAQLDLEHDAERYQSLLGVELRAIEEPGGHLGAAPWALIGADSDYGAEIQAALKATKTKRRLAIAAPFGAGRAALHYDDGKTALHLAERGHGRVALWTTTLDAAWSDVAYSSAMVPIGQRWVRWLGHAEEGFAPPVTLGEGVRLPKGFYQGVRLVGPEGQIRSARALPGQADGLWVGPLDAPGLWRGELTGEPNAREAPWLDCAVCMPLSESDFAPLPLPWRDAPVGATIERPENWAPDATLRRWLTWLTPALGLLVVWLLVLEGRLSAAVAPNSSA